MTKQELLEIYEAELLAVRDAEAAHDAKRDELYRAQTKMSNAKTRLDRVRREYENEVGKALNIGLDVETELEDDGRWIAEIVNLGLVAYGDTHEEAVRAVRALAANVNDED